MNQMPWDFQRAGSLALFPSRQVNSMKLLLTASSSNCPENSFPPSAMLFHVTTSVLKMMKVVCFKFMLFS
jgi:hypothetical protein